jgi:hypothetical protein
VDEIAGVQRNAKQVCWNKSELGGADTDHTDDGAIERSNNPTLPELFTEEDGAQDGQNTREIIESNHVEHIEHIGLMSLPQPGEIVHWRAWVPVLLSYRIISAPGPQNPSVGIERRAFTARAKKSDSHPYEKRSISKAIPGGSAWEAINFLRK